jgi:RNA polymerase sigma-70 factor (ECF subfamily)
VAVDAVSSAAELRRLYPRVLAKTLSLTRGIPDAEDAVQDAIERALAAWPRTGMPDSPEAWLVTVAANCYRDRRRRRRREEDHADALSTLAGMSPWVQGAVAMPSIVRGWKDDLLRLLFACCHPALEPGESAALALSTVLGLSTTEIADAFIVAPRTMEQRLTRARRRLRETGDDEAPAPAQADDRIDAVLCALHLLFNEGYWSADDAGPIRKDLCRLALGLTHSLHELRPDIAEVDGLLALLLFHDARVTARRDEHGVPIPLPEQDRSRWDRAQIAEASAILRAALARGTPGPFQLEAAISAVHCDARAAADTDWAQIAELYGLLEAARPSPAVRINRAFAVSRVAGAAEGLALLETGVPADAPYLALVRGVLLAELGRADEAVAELAHAEAGARNVHEAAQIRARAQAITRSAASRD